MLNIDQKVTELG